MDKTLQGGASGDSLQGAHVFVFGGSTGIGLAAATHAARAGAALTLAGRTPEKLDAAVLALPGARTVVADIANREAVEAAFTDVPKIDHLVITAGRRIVGKIAAEDPDHLLQAMRERVFGVVYAVRAALPVLSPRASIVLMSGVLAERPTATGTAVIAAASAAVEGLVRGLALELQPMRVNAVAPGFTNTTLLDSLGEQTKSAILKRAAETSPVQRVGTVDDIARAIMFLMTSGYVSGEILRIDGGSRLT